MDYQIRDALVEDALDIRRVQEETWVATYQNPKLGITESVIRSRDFCNPAKVQSMADKIKFEKPKTWVATVNNQVVGYCSAEKNDENDELCAIYVLPKFQGIGIGSVLMREVLKWLGNSKPLYLGVVPYNQTAINFYKNFGFKVGEPIQHDESTFPSGIDMPEIEMIKLSK